MKFLKIKIKNFGPYKGDQIFEFPTNPEKGVTVIFGDNMRGKTSFLNSIRWVLFGNALDRQSKPIDLLKLLNTEAREKGEYTYSVLLKFEGDGHIYELFRECKLHDLIATPTKGQDFGQRVLMKKDDKSLPDEQIPFEINRFISEDISRFYLFDGELLQQYEALLIDESTQGREIKDSIEHILGVPTLIKGRKDLSHLLKKSQNLLAKESKHDKTLEAYSQQSLNLQDDTQRLESDLEELDKKLNEIAEEIGQIDDELAKTGQVQKIQIELESNQRNLDSLKLELSTNEEKKFNLLSEAWIALLMPRFQLEKAHILKQMQSSEDAIQDIGASKERIRLLKSLFEGRACEMCNLLPDEHQRVEIGGQIGQLEVKLETAKSNMENLAKLADDIRMLEEFPDTNVTTSLLETEDLLSSIEIKITGVETKIDDLSQLLRNHDVGEIARLQKRKEALLELKGRIRTEADKVRKETEDANRKIEQFSRLMTKSPAARKSRTARQVETYSALLQIFEKSIERLRDRLREKVATEASRVFTKLTTEPSFTGLSINENYGLTIQDRSGNDVQIYRSAGAEQIVAMSLISALNTTANRPGPVIVDTPFGRLDPRHRTNILKHVPEMAQQVVFLVHEGEVNKETDLQKIMPFVESIFEIERVSPTHSILKSVEV